MQQLPLDAPLMDLARARGEAASQAAATAAERRGELSVADAQRFVLGWLARHGAMSGEDLVDAAVAHGHHPRELRAFGQVFAGLSKRGAIRCIAIGLRAKGNGTSGSRTWELVA